MSLRARTCWRGLLATLLAISLCQVSSLADAKNPDLSFWTKNLSESAAPAELGEYDSAQEIEVEGSTVHVMWITKKADWSGYKLFYRRSTDNGASFEPIRNLFAAANAHHVYDVLAAKGSYVYSLFVTTDADVYLRRSTDGGENFLGLQELTSAIAPKISQGWWPVIKTDPTIASGAKTHVLWTYPTYVCSGTPGQAWLIYPTARCGTC
ncbi:MAG: hypothetical protein AB9866_08030 [Syntrophobacteraceae bacterium]